MDVHLRDLRYFVAVAEELHFTNAAHRLSIAQPTLSRQIRQLERQLDVQLFDRDQRNVVLTPAGRELLEGARKVLAQWDETVSGRYRAGRTLRIGIQPAVEHALLAELEAASGVRLEPYTASPTDPSGGLADRQADLALVWLPLPDPDRYRWTVLRREERWVVLPDRHPLAELDEVPLAELSALPRITDAATAEQQLEAVTLGQGAMVLPRDSVALYRWPGVTARPVAGLEPIELALAWPADDDRELVAELVAAASRN